MLDVAQLAPRLRIYFTQTADALARETGFVQRESKLTGAIFVQSLVFGFQEQPEASLGDLIETCHDLGADVTRQGLHDRLPDAVAFLKAMVEQGLRVFRHQLPLEVAVLKQFTAIRLTDSTQIALPVALRDEFPGCGGDGPEAAVKVQLTFELLTGNWEAVDWQAGRSPDQTYTGQMVGVRPGSLNIGDLGYFAVHRFQDIDRQDAYFLSRFDLQTALFDPETGERLDLLEWLRAQTKTHLETHWLVGVQEKLPCRVIVIKLPPEVADRRRQKAHETARRKGRTPSARHLELLGWNIYITNVPPTLLTLKQIVVMYTVRWQVELIFKLWKSQCALDRVAGRHRPRVWCELYAKMIGLVVTHFLLAPFRLGERELSAVKVQRILQHHALRLAQSLDSVEQLTQQLEQIIARCLTHGNKDKRRQRLTTLQKLQVAES